MPCTWVFVRGHRTATIPKHSILYGEPFLLQSESRTGLPKQRTCDYLADKSGWNIIAMETDKDHIHIILEDDTTERICDIISIIKWQMSYYLWLRYNKYLSRQYWKKHIFWSDGYFVCSIGEASSATIDKYIVSKAKKRKRRLLAPFKKNGFPPL